MKYIAPEIEVLPIVLPSALCTSPEGGGNGSIGGGNDPEANGRGPKRITPF